MESESSFKNQSSVIFWGYDVCHDDDDKLSGLSSSSPSNVPFLESFKWFLISFSVIKLELVCLFLVLLVLQRIHCNGKPKKGALPVSTSVEAKGKAVNFPQVTWFCVKLPLILNGWRTVSKIGTDGMSVFTECSLKYGKIFQLPFGPLNVIATWDIEIIQKLLSSNNPHHLNKSGYIYKRLFVEELHDGLFVAKSSIWLPHRKSLSRGFTYKTLLSSLNMINKYSRNLTSDILALSSDHDGTLENGDVFADYLSAHLLRFTGDLITGDGSYTNNEISQIQQSIKTHKDCLLYVFRNPLLFLRPLWRCHSRKKISDGATRIMHTALKKVQSKLKDPYKIIKDPAGAISHIWWHILFQMIANYKSKGLKKEKEQQGQKEDDKDGKFQPLLELMLENKWSEKEILDNFATFIFAENEATFAGIQFSLLHLALNPEHQAICRTEIDALFSSKIAIQKTTPSSSSPPPQQKEQDNINNITFLSMTDLSQLKYLERCIFESLRLSPPVPVFARRLGAPLRINDNLEISSGKTLLVMPYILHRDESIWINPDKFLPDRFRFCPDQIPSRPPYSYLPFSAGRRGCLGWKLSHIQLKVTLAWLLRYFEISTSDKLEDVKMLYAVRIIPERNFNIIFKRRLLDL